MTTILRTFFSLMYLATASMDRDSSTEGGVFSSTTVDGSLPMMRGKKRPGLRRACWWRGLRRRPMVTMRDDEKVRGE